MESTNWPLSLTAFPNEASLSRNILMKSIFYFLNINPWSYVLFRILIDIPMKNNISLDVSLSSGEITCPVAPIYREEFSPTYCVAASTLANAV